MYMKAMKVEFGSKTLDLVLDGSAIIDIEKQLGKSLFGIMMTGTGGMKMPRLGEMLVILQSANTKANVKKADMTKLYDEYIVAGGTQMTLFEVIQELMEKAGFFEAEDKTKEAKTGDSEDESLV